MLFSSLADKVSLNLCRKPKGKSQHFALDVITKAVVVLDSPHTAFLCHADVQNLHNHKEIPTQPRQLATNDDVVLVHLLQEVSELPLGIVLRTADSLLYPVFNLQFVILTELVNLKTLVLHRLLVATHSNVPVDPKNVIEEAIRKAMLNQPKKKRNQIGIADLYELLGNRLSLDKLRTIPPFTQFENNVINVFKRIGTYAIERYRYMRNRSEDIWIYLNPMAF